MNARHAGSIIELEDGRELAFAEFGDPEGVPVLGFHGTPGSRRLLAPLDAHAREARVRLIAPDRPGCGASDFQPHRALVDWARDVAALAGLLGLDQFGVVGVSGGGPYALVCAHALGPRLIGVATVGGVAPVDDPSLLDDMLAFNRLTFRMARRGSAWVRPQMAAMVRLGRRAPDTMIERLAGSLPEPDRLALARPELRGPLLDDLRRTAPSAGRAAAQEFALFAQPWGFRLEEVAVDVDVFQGEQDRNVPPAHARRMAERIPGARLHLYPEHGHLSLLDEGPAVLRAASGRAPAPGA